MWRNTFKVIHSLQLHISHQMRSYSSAKIIWRLSYTCFGGTWVFLKGKVTNTPKSSTQSQEKKSKVFNSLFHIIWDLKLVSRPFVGQRIPVSQVLSYCGNVWKLGLNTPNNVQGHMENNPKFSAPCFTSNQTLL